MKKVLFLALGLFVCNISFGQATKAKNTTTKEFKIGYIFEDYVLDNYHELKKLDSLLQGRQKEMQAKYNDMAIEYQTKYLEYQKDLTNLDSVTTESLNLKLKAVQKIKTDAEDFQRDAEKDLQAYMSMSIMKVKEDVKAQTKIVADKKGYPFVINRNQNESLMQGNKMVLYYNDKGQHNLSDAVLEALGSKPPKK